MMNWRLLSQVLRGINRVVPRKPLDRVSILDDINKLCDGHANIVFDVGAHHGRYALEVGKKIRIQSTYCFEPFPQSHDILRKNLDRPGFFIYQLALSDFEGDSKFYVNQFDETNSLLPSVKTNSPIDELTVNHSIIQVPVQTLTGFCLAHNIVAIDILKIDTQGSTLNVLQGAAEFLKKGAIEIIQCEIEFLEIYQGESLFHHVASYLEQFNYILYSLYNIHYDVNDRISWADALFYRDAKKN